MSVAAPRYVTRRTAALLCAGGAIVGAAASLACAAAGLPTSEPRISAGTQALAVDERSILALTFQTPGVRVSAHRWTAGADAFEVTVQGRDGRRFERCRSGAGFVQIVASLSTVRVRRQLGRKEESRLRATLPEAWTFLEIADEVEMAPSRFRLAFSPEGAEMVLDGEVSFETDLRREPFDTLATRCAKLSPNDEAGPR